MDSIQKLNRICSDMIVKQEAKIVQAKDENQASQTIAELGCTLVGIKSVYNVILQLDSSGDSISEEITEVLEPEHADSTCPKGLTLDEAIKGFIKKERKYLDPLYSEALNQDVALQIKTME